MVKYGWLLVLLTLSLASCKTSAPQSAGLSDAEGKGQATSASSDVETDIQYVKANASGMVAALKAAAPDQPAPRDFHSKGMCLKGTLTIEDGIPGNMRLGPFAQPASYLAFARFSNGRPGRASDDRMPSVFGLGLKVLDVPGEKFPMPGVSKPRNQNQDWNMATGRTFHIPDAKTYAAERLASTFRESDPAKYQAFQAANMGIFQHQATLVGWIDGYTETTYHSQAAFQFGDRQFGKFSARPCDKDWSELDNVVSTLATTSEEQRAALAGARTPNFLREKLEERIGADDVCFIISAQVRPSDDYLPTDKADWKEKYAGVIPTKNWDINDIPEIDVARLVLPQGQPYDQYQDECDAFSINPANTSQALRPIAADTLNASRWRGAYEGSVTKRGEINQNAQFEPTGPADYDPMNAESSASQAALARWMSGGK